MIDRVTEGRYAYKKEKGGFCINRTMVLPLSGLVGDHKGPFQGRKNQPKLFSGPKAAEIARPPHNSG